MIFLQLFYEFFKVGLFAVGGGLATVCPSALALRTKAALSSGSTSAEPAARTASNAPVQQSVKETWEDYMFNEKDLGYYWREFASLLPKEEAANAGRMMNMHPHLLADQQTFEVAVDNDMVQKYMQQLAPKIEAHLQEKLHNRKIRMTLEDFPVHLLENNNQTGW